MRVSETASRVSRFETRYTSRNPRNGSAVGRDALKVHAIRHLKSESDGSLQVTANRALNGQLGPGTPKNIARRTAFFT